MPRVADSREHYALISVAGNVGFDSEPMKHRYRVGFLKQFI